jgi:hypothetical protein
MEDFFGSFLIEWHVVVAKSIDHSNGQRFIYVAWALPDDDDMRYASTSQFA